MFWTPELILSLLELLYFIMSSLYQLVLIETHIPVFYTANRIIIYRKIRFKLDISRTFVARITNLLVNYTRAAEDPEYE